MQFPYPVPTDAEKDSLWKAYRARNPVRVPLRWNANVRHILLDPALNPENWTFHDYIFDPDRHISIRIRFQEYLRTAFSQVSDMPSALPDHWTCAPDVQNTYDALYFGARLQIKPGQVPFAEPCYTLEDVDRFLAMDFSNPLNNPFIREQIGFAEKLVRAARGRTHLGLPVQAYPFTLGFDGPLTAAAALFGTDFFLLLGDDPPKASRVLETITREVLRRNKALLRLAGKPDRSSSGFFADDSIQLIGVETYRQYVLPSHRLYYEEMFSTPFGQRGIHLCGDATRHFKTIRDELGVFSFDTGFPVDHGALRRELGPDVEISGGPPVPLLLSASPPECAADTLRILRSGIMEGGRFILQEGNNLSPKTPLENMAAVYQTCLEHGRYTRNNP